MESVSKASTADVSWSSDAQWAQFFKPNGGEAQRKWCRCKG